MLDALVYRPNTIKQRQAQFQVRAHPPLSSPWSRGRLLGASLSPTSMPGYSLYRQD